MVEDESAVVGVLTATRNAGRGKVVNCYKGKGVLGWVEVDNGYIGNGGCDGVSRKGN